MRLTWRVDCTSSIVLSMCVGARAGGLSELNAEQECDVSEPETGSLESPEATDKEAEMRGTRCLLSLALCLLAPFAASAQWEPDVRLTDDPSQSMTSFNNARCVAAAGSLIHVVWHDDRDGNTEIYYKRSTDSGTTWETDTRLTEDASWSERPSVAIGDAVVHVAWYDGRIGPPRIFYKRSPDNGTTWSPDVCLTPTAGVGYHPSVTVSGSIVHVAWTDMSAGPQIYYTRSLDNGATWEAARNITPNAPAAGKNLASIAVSGSIVHVTWMDSRSGPQIYYTRSLDSGVTWEIDRAITPVPSQFASVAVSGAVVHVVYSDFRAGGDAPRIWYTRSLDNGTTWETAVPLAEAFASWYPSVAVSGSHVHAVWLDSRNGDVSEVYYKDSLDGGANWGTDVRLTDNPSESFEPSVAVSGNFVHVAWHDDRDQNLEIYYKRGTTDMTGVEEDGSEAFSIPRLVSTGPNPSTGQVVFRYDLPSSASVMLEIFDPSGALVWRSMRELQPSGSHETRWEGHDGAGRAVPSGVYLTRIEMDGRVMKGRVVLAR
jgi:hypothetical protein